jgi:glutamate dehydrogenase (NAD(P)+)
LGAAKARGVNVDGARVTVQGFGRVGSVVAEMLAKAGAKVVGIADDRHAVTNPDGIDVRAAIDWVQKRDTVQGTPGTEQIARADVFALACDILVSAGVQHQITAEVANTIRAGILAEAGNSPTTPEADAILRDRGVFVIPDILCTAGGLAVAYFEWVQDMQAFFWSEEEIAAELDRIIDDAFAGVMTMSASKGVDMRGAAMMVAVGRVAQATMLRGLYP